MGNLSIIKEKLQSHKVALVGSPEAIAKYYTKAKHRVERFFVLERESLESESLMCFDNIKTDMFGEDKLDIYYYVLCPGENVTFDKMVKALENNGLFNIHNFVEMNIASAAMQDKKIMCFLGTAFLKQIATALSTVPDITCKYLILYFPFSEIMMGFIDRFLECKNCIEFSELLVYSNCKDINYLNNLTESAKLRISVTDIYFRGYFPQLSEDRKQYSDYLYRERKRTKINYSTYYFAKHDENILKFCFEGLEEKQIVSQILSNNFYDESELEKLFETEITKVKEIDKDSDIKLAKLIVNNRKCYPINLEEWSNDTVIEVAKQIIDLLHMEISINENVMEEQIENTKGSTLPIYPCIKERYDLMQSYDNLIMLSYTKREKLDINDYLHRQIEYLYTAINMNRFLFGQEE